MWSTDPWGPQEPLGSSRGQMYFHSNAKMAFASFTVLMAASMVRKQGGGRGTVAGASARIELAAPDSSLQFYIPRKKSSMRHKHYGFCSQ